jgi:hypothetical protein
VIVSTWERTRKKARISFIAVYLLFVCKDWENPRSTCQDKNPRPDIRIKGHNGCFIIMELLVTRFFVPLFLSTSSFRALKPVYCLWKRTIFPVLVTSLQCRIEKCLHVCSKRLMNFCRFNLLKVKIYLWEFSRSTVKFLYWMVKINLQNYSART